MAYSDFEDLLNQHAENMEKMEYNEYGDMKNGVFDSRILKADKTASLFDFIKMIDKIITLTMKDLEVEFIPDEGKTLYLSSDFSVDHPIITYKVLSRMPKGEIKPRFREGFSRSLASPEEEVGEIYGQKFKCHLQFDIFASEYTVAEQVMERFEDMMITYAGYFKRNGVAELLFDQQFTDSHFESMRQTLSIRNISYYVEIEKLTVIMRENIKDIETY